MEKLEGLDQIEKLLDRNSDISVEPIKPTETPGFENCVNPDGWLQTTPAHLSNKGGVDGFFIARLRKK